MVCVVLYRVVMRVELCSVRSGLCVADLRCSCCGVCDALCCVVRCVLCVV